MNKERILIHYGNGGFGLYYEFYNDTISINRKQINITRTRQNRFDSRITEKSIVKLNLDEDDVNKLYEDIRYILVNKIGTNHFHEYACDGDHFDFIVFDEVGNKVVTNEFSTCVFEIETNNIFRLIRKYYDIIRDSLSKKEL